MKVTTPELPQNKPPGLGTTVDGSEIWRENKLRLIVYPIIYGGFLHPRWLFGDFLYQQYVNVHQDAMK